jgi:hypothetical protein
MAKYKSLLFSDSAFERSTAVGASAANMKLAESVLKLFMNNEALGSALIGYDDAGIARELSLHPTTGRPIDLSFAIEPKTFMSRVKKALEPSINGLPHAQRQLCSAQLQSIEGRAAAK